MSLDDARTRSRVALAALALAAGHGAWTLAGRAWFPHAGLPGGQDAVALAEHVVAALVVLAGMLLGAAALRRAVERATIVPATIALALLAPFAVDLVLAPLPLVISSGAARSVIYLVASVVALLRVVASGGTALRRAPALVPSPRRAALARLAGRLALLLAVLALALLGAELLFRELGLGARNWSRSMLIVPGDERRVPLSEIALFRPFDAPAAAEGLSARFRPYTFLRGWYDRPRWSYFDEGGQVDYVFNRYGLRDHDFELEKQPGEFRVVAIGDSFTFGVGVQLEDCWTEVTERELRQRRGGPVEVINAGFAGGYKTLEYEDWILRDGVRLKPDVILVGFCLNDMNRNVSLYAWTDPRKLDQWAGGASRVLNALQTAWVGPAPPRHLLDYTKMVAKAPGDWNGAKAALHRLHEALAAQGIRLVVVPFPMVSGLRETPYPFAALLDQVNAFLDAEHIERIDLLPRVIGLVDEDLWVHPTDQHPNDVGHRLFAGGIVESLERK